MTLQQKFSELIELESIRYKRKGILNIVIAVMLLSLILKTANMICHSIWPAEVQNKQLFVVGISCFIHLFCQCLYFSLYIPGYLGLSSWYEKFRINSGVKWAWDNQKQNWPKLRIRLLTYLGINYFIIYPGLIIVSTWLSGLRVRFDDLPTTLELAWQLLFVAVVEDTFFYWAHRLSHQIAFLYKFHKVHHEYTNVFSLATEFTHPVDYVLGILIPSAIPFILLGSRAHCFMFFFWQVWKMFISTEGHCGYYFPWSPSRILFCVSDPSFHDFHHSKNVGNYAGSIYMWDFICDSARTYFDLEKSKQKLSKLN